MTSWRKINVFQNKKIIDELIHLCVVMIVKGVGLRLAKYILKMVASVNAQFLWDSKIRLLNLILIFSDGLLTALHWNEPYYEADKILSIAKKVRARFVLRWKHNNFILLSPQYNLWVNLIQKKVSSSISQMKIHQIRLNL